MVRLTQYCGLPVQILYLVSTLVAAVEHPQPRARSFLEGDLLVGIGVATNGLRLASLYDMRLRQELLTSPALPLFSLTLRQAGGKGDTTITADTGWRKVSCIPGARGFVLRWHQPLDAALQGISVQAIGTMLPSLNEWRWDLRVENKSDRWSITKVLFPQVALADLGTNAAVLFPRGPGEVQRDLWRRKFSYHGNYPGGWCAMQFMAAYREGPEPTGLYFAVHDPWGSTKDLSLEGDPATHAVRMRFEHPAPNLGRPGNSFRLSGRAIWKLLRGDWFDAAVTYRDWVRREARWWPRLTDQGRPDVPPWMRALNIWAQTGGAPADCVPRVLNFQRFLNVPLGFHWYNWHQIPFDNDYPHYFPAKPGFDPGVAELQRNGVFAMPYINGRLWDSHDRGSEDFEFTRRALAAATKRDNGQPYLESYGSKETNGNPVRLAAICPTTPLWQQTVRDLVLKLTRESGTRAVYIDQIAAAAPTLCMDPSHGHPLGGGHWWNEGYWNMLDTIRRALPDDAALTTECNGEPFVRWFDGYLTWHWQYDGQVPAFPAVYGSAIPMFGRAYRGGPTKDLALRMKAAQQLVFGEQIGWLDPTVLQEKDNADFLRKIVQLRARLNRYFSAGEMDRPPKLMGTIPKARTGLRCT